MNWFKENKFLSGFLIAMVIGVGVLGFLLLSAKGSYDEALAAYQEKVGELARMQKSPTFPNQKNLDKILEQKKQATGEAAKLKELLMAQQIPPEEMSAAGFQDKLKAAVSSVKAKAAQSSPPVLLPEKFFLGFDKYETAPPDAEAAVPLGRQLKVIEWIVGHLIESRVAQIKSLDRTELPEEKGKAKEEKKPVGARTAAKVALQANPLEVVFLADQSKFKQFLNALLEYKGQLLIPRAIIVNNENPKGPARVVAPVPGADPNAPAATPAAPAAGTPPAAVPAAPAATYIVGEERVEAKIVIDVVNLSEAAAK